MNSDYLDILHQLQKHHALFSEFWSVGRIVEDERLPTAAIEFDESGDGVRFLVNPTFWEGLTLTEKTFVICHECLHVYFEHGRRFHGLARGKNKIEKMQIFQRANKAGDIVINHYLVDVFGFDRDELVLKSLPDVVTPDGRKIEGADKLCWRDTVFPGDKSIEANRSMEYYYGKLVEKAEQQKQQGGSGDPTMTLDDHDGLLGAEGEGQGQDGSGSSQAQHEKRMRELVDNLTRRLSDEELQDFEQKAGMNGDENATSQQAGNMGGEMVKRIRLGKVKKKRKWETVIQDVLGRFKGKERDIPIEQWARKARRMATIGGDLMLPSDIDEIVPIRDRIDVWFFQDTSGSCVDYAERFFKAAASIPEDRFKIRGFCFDTRVYEVDFKKGELKGFGGTAFHVIEQKIQEIVKNEKCQYPQAVFVITDGFGNPVSPQHAERWHWFLTDDRGGFYGHTDQYVPRASRKYSLKDFE